MSNGEMSRTSNRGQGPTEDEHGNRLHSAAGQAVNQSFGGLALGFSGGTPADTLIDEATYRSPLFQPGTNLGPPYQDELRMTAACLPAEAGRRGDLRTKSLKQSTKLPQVEAVFSPRPGGDYGMPPWRGLPPYVHRPIRHPCQDWAQECPGEDLPRKKMFVFFGKSEKKRPIYCPPVFETSEATVFEYFESHNIESLMEYFLTLLCIHFPDDPFEYMKDLSEQMIRSRTDKSELERMDVVFEPSHLLAMFSLFDKQEKKSVSVEQYKTAMEMLGITRYNRHPVGYSKDTITEDVFFDETTKALSLLLKDFTG